MGKKDKYCPTFDTKADLERTLNFAALAARVIEVAQSDYENKRNPIDAKVFLESEWCETLTGFVQKVTSAYEHDMSGKQTCLRGGF